MEKRGAPLDVLWFRMSRRPGDPESSMGRFDPGAALVLINRRESFRAMLARLLPWTASRVQIDCLRQWWRPGLLCIGDAAHAMSPVGGVGINIAIQDAVATGNFLAAGDFSAGNLQRSQRRRRWPARFTQRLPIAAQDCIIARILSSRSNLKTPLFFRLLTRFPRLRPLPGPLIGMGVRSEHILCCVAKRE